MRFLPGLICLLPLLSPLAHAELIDDVNDRGELRIALEANTPLFSFKKDDKLEGFEVELGQMLADELDVRADFVVTDGRARRRTVKIGRNNGTQAQVLEGLKKGETVILFPASDIADGTRVERRSAG